MKGINTLGQAVYLRQAWDPRHKVPRVRSLRVPKITAGGGTKASGNLSAIPLHLGTKDSFTNKKRESVSRETLSLNVNAFCNSFILLLFHGEYSEALPLLQSQLHLSLSYRLILFPDFRTFKDLKLKKPAKESLICRFF